MTPKKISYRNTANGMIEKMAVRGMDGYYCDTREEACAKALELMEEGASVSFGGSVTLNEIGLLEQDPNVSRILGFLKLGVDETFYHPAAVISLFKIWFSVDGHTLQCWGFIWSAFNTGQQHK